MHPFAGEISPCYIRSLTGGGLSLKMFRSLITIEGLMRFLTLLTFVVLGSVSCAHIDYNMPVNRFDTPETKGHFFGGEIALDYKTSQKITLAEAYDAVVIPLHGVVDTTVTIRDSRTLSTRSQLGLLSRLDAYARGTADGPSTYGLKFQFVGEGEDKLSTGFKGAISAGYGTMSENGEQTIDKTWGTPKTTVRDTYKTDLDVSVKEVSLLLGQRFDKNFLAYLNFFGASYQTKASFLQNGVEQFHTDKTSEQYGVLLGLRAGEKSSLKIETGVAQAKWGSFTKTSIPIGVSLAWGW